MTLKPLKIVVTRALRSAHDPFSEDCYHCHAADAQAEIAALEKAAKILTDDEVKRALRHAPDDVQDTIEWLATIAKEAE